LPAGASSTAATAAAASSIHTVGRYASRRPTLGETPFRRAASMSVCVSPLSGPMKSPKRRTTVSPAKSSRTLVSAAIAAVVLAPSGRADPPVSVRRARAA